VPQYEEVILRVFHGSDFVTKLSKVFLCESILANMTLADPNTLGFLIMGACFKGIEAGEIIDLASSSDVVKELTILQRSPPIFYIVKRSFGVQRALLEVKAFIPSMVFHDIHGVKNFRVVIEGSMKGTLVSLVRRNALEIGEKEIRVRLKVKRRTMSPNPFEMGQLSRIRTEISSSGLLTPLEYLVLKRAYEMGYFEWPRRCSLEQLSRDLKLSKSTTLEHLRKAIRKLIVEYFIF